MKNQNKTIVQKNFNKVSIFSHFKKIQDLLYEFVWETNVPFESRGITETEISGFFEISELTNTDSEKQSNFYFCQFNGHFITRVLSNKENKEILNPKLEFLNIKFPRISFSLENSQ